MKRDWRASFSNTMHTLIRGESLYERLKNLRPENTDIIICPAHLGDTVWTAALAGAYLKTHDCEGLYYAVYESQADVVRHFPDIEKTVSFSIQEMSDLKKYITVMRYYYDNHIVYPFMSAVLCVDYPEFIEVEYDDIKIDSILQRHKVWMKIEGNVSLSRMLPPDDENAEELRQMFGNAVLLIPSAQTCFPVPLEFWNRLCKIYSEIGYSVYYNYNGFEYEKKIEGALPLSTSPIELAQIGSCFAQVIAQRSGACDLLAEVESNLSVIYYKENEKKVVVLPREDLGEYNIFELVDRPGIVNYQYVEGMEDELVDLLLAQAMQ